MNMSEMASKMSNSVSASCVELLCLGDPFSFSELFDVSIAAPTFFHDESNVTFLKTRLIEYLAPLKTCFNLIIELLGRGEQQMKGTNAKKPNRTDELGSICKRKSLRNKL